jgi:RNA polymerase sigma-70 factor (ECF subfamily)
LLTAAQEQLLVRYVDAFERYDIEALVELLVEDATVSMPPRPLWLRGRASIRQWWLTEGTACAGSHLVAVGANGAPAFASTAETPLASATRPSRSRS